MSLFQQVLCFIVINMGEGITLDFVGFAMWDCLCGTDVALRRRVI